jgi:hypothetical protein
MSLDNSLMMEIYPFGGVLAYLKFNFIDGMTKQNLMLLDKTRVDYNSDKEKTVGSQFKTESQTDEQLVSFLGNVGIGGTDTDAQRAERIKNELEKQ